MARTALLCPTFFTPVGTAISHVRDMVPTWTPGLWMHQNESSGCCLIGNMHDISNFWFRHLEDDHVIIPGIEDATPWFSQSHAYGQECLDKFGAQLELIQSIQPSGADILAAASPSAPLHWVSLIILLDQLPRNCFRGAQARMVFTLFDKLAFEVASQALGSGIPMDRQVRFQLAQVLVIYANGTLREMWHDYEMLLEKAVEGWDGDFAYHRAVLLRRKDSFEKFRGTMRGICESKKDILRRFGRFPQRNDALGRPSTAEELQFLNERW
ncbi:hypothetical protein BKA66DRAFT_546827 [Pyrenochaeta sp. MPI-SDFR-AT-0127]|nr:hypothetical protein BKA66DRAFT_546827 [Pyrenochaeta sp. MPI-SDFR-AT-0127]